MLKRPRLSSYSIRAVSRKLRLVVERELSDGGYDHPHDAGITIEHVLLAARYGYLDLVARHILVRGTVP
jgi:hypothetical protein